MDKICCSIYHEITCNKCGTCEEMEPITCQECGHKSAYFRNEIFCDNPLCRAPLPEDRKIKEVSDDT